MKRENINEAEAERRSKPGELVMHEEIQTAATTLKCRIVIYHARPAPGEPDKDIVSPEGGKTALRDIYMVLRNAHYTVLLGVEAANQRSAAIRMDATKAEGGDGVRHGQEMTARQ